MAADEVVQAWRPAVPGVTEVFHAHFVDHRYPLHTHDAWTLLIVDDGAIQFDLDLRHHDVARPSVTVLPPHVPHDGRRANEHGFRKRVVYLEPAVLGERLVGAAVDRPILPDPQLRRRIDQLHVSLAHAGDELEAESRLALIGERLREHLTGTPARRSEPPSLADRLRELLDSRVAAGVTLREAAALLDAHPTHLVRAFTGRFGLPPHRYLTARRVDVARRLLLTGRPVADVAVAAGFYDQPHLTRIFRRYLGTTPARFASLPYRSPFSE